MSRRQRMAGVMVIVVGLLTIGFATGFGSEASAEPTVQAFLLDWQQGKYAQAATLTNGNPGMVAAQLAAVHVDLDATETFLAMRSVTQHGASAAATFKATVTLAEGGHPWTYVGRFGLSVKNGVWVVDWAPSVIHPSLRPGDRLAVITAFAPRAQIEDSAGLPLLAKSADYHIGVSPGTLAHPATTASRFSRLADLNPQQVLGQIQAAPPRGFLSLLTLDPASFRSMWPRLSKIPGMRYERRTERLFGPSAAEIVGSVGTEGSKALRNEGAAYQPGVTVGLSGLEQAYQDMLAGTPTTEVVVVSAAGRTGTPLYTAQGQAGAPLRTTLVSRDQAAATAALAAQAHSGEIVAMNASNGDILALAAHETDGVRLPGGGALNARLQPGMAFSIVSAAALLGAGETAKSPLPCRSVATVGRQTFTYQPGSSPSKTKNETFASAFATGCFTAFAKLSQNLTPAQLTTVEKAFGIGARWNLGVRAYSGSATAAADDASLARQVIGTGGVLMSPLGMAVVAAEVDAGTGHTPVLLASDPASTWQAPLSEDKLGALRQLMRDAVRSGSARGAQVADVAGKPVYGQAGVVRTGAHAWVSWFVGYRGGTAVAAIETGTTQAQAAASLAGAFLSKVR